MINGINPDEIRAILARNTKNGVVQCSLPNPKFKRPINDIHVPKKVGVKPDRKKGFDAVEVSHQCTMRRTYGLNEDL